MWVILKEFFDVVSLLLVLICVHMLMLLCLSSICGSAKLPFFVPSLIVFCCCCCYFNNSFRILPWFTFRMSVCVSSEFRTILPSDFSDDGENVFVRAEEAEDEICNVTTSICRIEKFRSTFVSFVCSVNFFSF
jgi:hypothetical protein